MSSELRSSLEDIFKESRKHLSPDVRAQLFSDSAGASSPEEFVSKLRNCSIPDAVPVYIHNLASIELAMHKTSISSAELSAGHGKFSLNPTLNMVPVEWQNLPCIVAPGHNECFEPVNKNGFVLVYKKAEDIIVEDATDELLLALKIATEKLDLRDLVKSSSISVWQLYCTLKNAAKKGVLIESPTEIRRPLKFPKGKSIDQSFFSSDVFTLQWHITQSCDLHCRHCYDRSDRSDVSFADAVKTLDQLYDFCAAKNVTGQVSFSGGNPFLHPLFKEIYKEASLRGFALAILGNPVSSEMLQEILSIEKPVFYQVSLEGLADYNNYVRGDGHFDRTLSFLELLKKFDIYSMVMLTLSRANMEQVIPLARILEDKVDLFTFNRLSVVGEAQNMLLPDRDTYKKFLEDFLKETETNKALVCKDNLINILLRDQCRDLFGGCAGHGCSAAFNFISLLSDGEVHACRKFPSKVGDIKTKSLIEIYDSELAERYRTGPSECSECDIRPVCGGCLAVANSFGIDIFSQKDPMCFWQKVKAC